MMDNDENQKNLLIVLGAPIAIVLLWLLFLPLGLLNAWAVQKMYGWFLLPLGAPQLNLWHVFGFVVLINHFKSFNPNDKRKVLEHILINILGITLLLLTGVIVKEFI